MKTESLVVSTGTASDSMSRLPTRGFCSSIWRWQPDIRAGSVLRSIPLFRDHAGTSPAISLRQALLDSSS